MVRERFLGPWERAGLGGKEVRRGGGPGAPSSSHLPLPGPICPCSGKASELDMAHVELGAAELVGIASEFEAVKQNGYATNAACDLDHDFPLEAAKQNGDATYTTSNSLLSKLGGARRHRWSDSSDTSSSNGSEADDEQGKAASESNLSGSATADARPSGGEADLAAGLGSDRDDSEDELQEEPCEDSVPVAVSDKHLQIIHSLKAALAH